MTRNRAADMALVARTLLLSDDEIADDVTARRGLVARLEKACRRFRQMGLDGHHAYSLPRHDSLHRIWRTEVAELGAIEAAHALREVA